ncbi:MAG: DUF1638 domain-containing protein [Deltaproteobacteria bacterium]|nr:DUF1638 domain-containing protein [Deltaproteobacteria bacterium]
MNVEGLGVVACDVVRAELERVVGDRDVPMRFLEYSLHSTPADMRGRIVEALAALRSDGAERAALGYGLCSNGVVGVESDGPLVMPRCHDCIAMLLGSPRQYFEMFRRHPGTYFLTEGWVRNYGDPLSSVERKYVPRMGEKKALRGMSLELANYKAFCFVDNGVGDRASVKARTLENCRVFKKEYMEVAASLDYFRALIDGPHGRDDFVELPTGDKIVNDLFYNII